MAGDAPPTDRGAAVGVFAPAVAVLRWPRDRRHRGPMVELGLPRLHLVEPGAAAPEVTRPDEEWLRLPATDVDIAARVDDRRRRHGTAVLDGPLLRTRRGTVVLSPSEAAVALGLLLADRVALRAELERRLRCLVAVGPRTLRDVVYRLRRRIRPLGLDVQAVRGRGFPLPPRLDWPIDDLVLV